MLADPIVFCCSPWCIGYWSIFCSKPCTSQCWHQNKQTCRSLGEGPGKLRIHRLCKQTMNARSTNRPKHDLPTWSGFEGRSWERGGRVAPLQQDDLRNIFCQQSGSQPLVSWGCLWLVFFWIGNCLHSLAMQTTRVRSVGHTSCNTSSPFSARVYRATSDTLDGNKC